MYTLKLLRTWGRSICSKAQGELGRGSIHRTSTGHWGSSGIGSWTPPLLHIHYITGSHHTSTWFLIPLLYADDTQLYLSFRPNYPTVAAWISGCLADISAWMKEHRLQLNLAKTELLVFPATPTLQHDFTIQLGSSTITPSSSVRNLGVIFGDQLTFKTTLQKLLDLAGLHCTTSERSGLSLLSMQLNFLSRPLSFQDWTTAMLF